MAKNKDEALVHILYIRETLDEIKERFDEAEKEIKALNAHKNILYGMILLSAAILPFIA